MSGLPEKIRAFIAVRIPDPVRAQLTDVQSALKQELRDVSWTRPEAMHLTLQFLGNVESARLPELEAALTRASRNIAAFELALSQPGSFGNRVIWIGCAGGAGPLTQLAESIRSAARPFAEHDEARPFNAHVTLGRARRPTRRVGFALDKLTARRFLPWTVNDFELIRSELSSTGSRYTVLAVISLAKTEKLT